MSFTIDLSMSDFWLGFLSGAGAMVIPLVGAVWLLWIIGSHIAPPRW